MLDVIGDRLDAGRASAAAEVDQYLANLREGVARQVTESEARMQKIRDDRAAWLNSLYDDEPVPTDVAQGQVDASAAGSSPASPPGSGPGQPNRHADELAEAERIRSMSMQDYARERQRLRASTSNRGMFG
jgi:hypothetical protein